MRLQDKNRGNHARRIAELGIFAALALVLSFLEGLLPPLPMMPPGAKLGLSNIVTMFIASSQGLVPALMIAVLKGLFAGVTRGFTAMILSLAGGILSTALMYLLFRTNKFGLIGVGVAGAFAHNAAQLACAYFLTSRTMLWYAPWLCVLSAATGTLSGLLLCAVLPLIRKLERK
ncbi:MAG: Gx transporter family protein [Clostridia bacterium]|nr:Gx transporter family protein [Clostridia bacterium]